MRQLDGEHDVGNKEKRAIALDRDFHTALCDLADNEFMNGFYRQLSLHVNMTLIHERTYTKLESQWAESHAEIVRALEQDPDHVTDILKRHFNNVLELLPEGEETTGNEPDTDPEKEDK